MTFDSSKTQPNSGKGSGSHSGDLNLSAIKASWYVGEWQSLIDTDIKSLPQSPHRALIALLIASAHMQNGNEQSARKLIRLAIKWGVSPFNIAKVLSAGVHATMVKIAILHGKESVAAKHLKMATDLVSDTRAKIVNIPEAHATGKRLVVLVAGMRHSGSTALFNAIRLGIESLGIPCQSGYTEKFDVADAQRQQKGIFLLKTHEYRDDVAELADFVFTTKRDLRDTVASAVRRKFSLCEQLTPLEYSKYNRQLWQVWQIVSDYEFQYERYMEYPVIELKEVFEAIGLDKCEADSIHRRVTQLPTDQYKVTLLSPTHITDPDRKLSYHDTLSSEQLSLISRYNMRWLELNGYE